MSCECRFFRPFVTILRNLVIFRMSYLRHKIRFLKTFFRFKFFPEYCFKIANLLWHKLEVIFYCQSYDVIFAQKPLKSKIQKHTIVGNTKFYRRAKSQLKFWVTIFAGYIWTVDQTGENESPFSRQKRIRVNSAWNGAPLIQRYSAQGHFLHVVT